MIFFNVITRRFVATLWLCSFTGIFNVMGSEGGQQVATPMPEVVQQQQSETNPMGVGLLSTIMFFLQSVPRRLLDGVTHAVERRISSARSQATDVVGTFEAFGNGITDSIGTMVVDTACARFQRPYNTLVNRTIPTYTSQLAARTQQRAYNFTNNYQRLYAALPFLLTAGGYAIASLLVALNTSFEKKLTYFGKNFTYPIAGGLAFAAVWHVYKAFSAYRATKPIRPDIQIPTKQLTVNQFSNCLIEALRLPLQRTLLFLESHNSIKLIGMDAVTQLDFVRNIAQQAQITLFTIDAETLHNEQELRKLIDQAYSAAQNGPDQTKCSICYIGEFDQTSLDDSIKHRLSQIIEEQTSRVFSSVHDYADTQVRCRRLQRQKGGLPYDRDEAEDKAEQEEYENAREEEELAAPAILFIAGMATDTPLPLFAPKKQFEATIELRADAKNITCGQRENHLTFQSIKAIVPRMINQINVYGYSHDWVAAHTVDELLTAAQPHDQHVQAISSAYGIDKIPGGYPTEIDEIVMELNRCLQMHTPPSIKGILLYGPPGCGKTYLAKALAGTLQAEFLSVRLAEIIVSEHGCDKLTEAFNLAQQKALESRGGITILCIDECDQLLQPTKTAEPAIKPIAYKLRALLNGIETGFNRVIFVAITNSYPNNLDEALIRPGRIDYLIGVPRPTCEKRTAIIRYHLAQQNINTLDEQTIGEFVNQTNGFSASALKAVIERTSRAAVRLGQLATHDLLVTQLGAYRKEREAKQSGPKKRRYKRRQAQAGLPPD